MRAAGLREVKRVTICEDGVTCIMSIMVPIGDGEQGEGMAGGVDEIAGRNDSVEGESGGTGEDSSSGQVMGKKGSKKKGSKKKGPKGGKRDEEALKKKRSRREGRRVRAQEEQRFSVGEIVIGITDGDMEGEGGEGAGIFIVY